MDYNEYVEFIKSCEAYDTEMKSISIDIYELGPEIGILDCDSGDALKVINYVNSIDTEQGKMPQGANSDSASKTTKHDAGSPPAGAGLQGRFKSIDVSREKEVVAKELKELISAAENTFSMHIKTGSGKSKLILTNLSLQDQISELEKISRGIDSRSFSKEQMSIIIIEIKGLAKNRGVLPKDEFQRGLYMIREGRLKEITSKLNV